MAESRDLELLVLASHKYQFLWHPLAFNLQTMFGDAIGALRVAAPGKVPRIRGVLREPLQGNPLDWSALAIEALERTSADHVILLLEDHFLRRRVAKSALDAALGAHQKADAVTTRINDKSVPGQQGSDQYVALNSERFVLASLTPAIWDVERLKSLLRPGETPWQFEREATRRMNQAGDVALSVARARDAPCHYWHDVIVQGRMTRQALRRVRPPLGPLPPEVPLEAPLDWFGRVVVGPMKRRMHGVLH